MKKRVGYYFLLPCTVFLLAFLLAPMLEMLFSTLFSGRQLTLAGYAKFFGNASFMRVFWRSLRLSVISTLICILLGFPTSYYIAKLTRKKSLFIALAVFPMLTSPVVRSFGWMVILGQNGMINSLLLRIHVIASPIRMLYNEFSIVVGFVQLFLPFMILSVVGVMENISDDLMLAAQSLGARHLRAFLGIILPLSVPGIVTGSVLVLTGSLTAYTTPALLGGSDTRVMATLIYENAMTLSDWTSASVIAVVMIAATVLIMGIIRSLAKRFNPVS